MKRVMIANAKIPDRFAAMALGTAERRFDGSALSAVREFLGPWAIESDNIYSTFYMLAEPGRPAAVFY